MWSNRENCKDLTTLQAIQQQLEPDPKGWYFFSGGPVTRSKQTHPWMSGVTMLVRWLCSSPASAVFALVGLSTFVRPRPQEMHPSATKGAREQVASCPRSAKAASVPMVLLSLDFGLGMHPTSRKGQSPSCWTFMFTEGHVQRVPGYGGEDL